MVTDKCSFAFFRDYCTQYKGCIGQIILLLLASCLLQLILPFLIQEVVDVGLTNQDFDFLLLVLIGLAFSLISRTLIDFGWRWISLYISMRINRSLVSDFFIKLVQLPMSFFDTKLLVDLLQRINDHARVEKFPTTQTLTVLYSLLSFIVLGCVLLNYSFLIFIVFIIGSLLYGIWIAVFLSKRKQLDTLFFEQQAASNNKTYQFISQMQEIKLQDCEQRRRWECEDVQADLFQINMSTIKLQQAQEAGSLLINEMKNIIIMVLAATAVINGNMTLGMMLAVLYIIGQLHVPVEQLITFIYSLQDVKISLGRINEIHEMKNEENNPKAYTHFPDADKSLCFKHLDFKYDPHNPSKTLDQINFTIPQGKVTAIVGASGSGKTTLIKLLLGYYPAQSGEINIGQSHLHDYNKKWWRRQCGVVMQDGVIFSESIARNIAVDDNEIDGERLLEAVRIANIQDYIMGLPSRYSTLIGQDGIGLSQGEKQRILLARAVYKNPQYIFLDEATNTLDAANERVIIENLNKFYQGKTVVVVAHRLSMVKNADQIVVVDKGKVIEIGTHAKLLKNKGAYFNLVKNQLELGN